MTDTTLAPARRKTRRSLLARLVRIVGDRHLLTSDDAMRRYATGYRTGGGPCLAVVRPGTLLELWRVLQACVDGDCIIIMQAANTGLTGGSTPTMNGDRDAIVINTLRIDGIRLIDNGAQAICLAGATLDKLEKVLKPFGREPHSVIGSSCIGASVIGGVCNNSGGALVRRGPAYTELALYARLNEAGQLEMVNHLGLRLGSTPEAMLEALDRGDTRLDPLASPTDRLASDHEYQAHVRDIDAASPARFNADARRLHEASGSAGKVAVFAVRLDTFALEPATVTYYVGTNDPDDLTWLRREILASPSGLPIAGEYMHREAFDVAARYGKDAYLAIRMLGAERLPWLHRAKAALDDLSRRVRALPARFSDRLLQALAGMTPHHLPVRLRRFRDLYAHHLILKIGADDGPATRALLERLPSGRAGHFECTAREGESAFLHRFVTAGAAIRYRAVHEAEVEEIVALDFALRRNDRDWVETLPEALERQLVGRLCYGHFLCHVFHHDYLLRKGCDADAFEHELCALLDQRGAEYPAEHNVGHLYPAKAALERHYRALDPHNVFNPGIGKLSKQKDWDPVLAAPRKEARDHEQI